jgi:hypothetical protein
MSHQVPYFGVGEIGDGEGLKVNKKAVPECPFDPTCRSQKKVPPDISKSANAQGKEEDFQSIDQKARMRNSAQGEVIDSVFDDPWDEELKDINDQESDESDRDPPSVFNEIILKSFKRPHSPLLSYPQI